MSNNPPGQWKDNPLTRQMERVSELNRSYGYGMGGSGAPRMAPAPPPAEAPPAIMQSGLSETGMGGLRTAPPLDPEEQRRREMLWNAQTGEQVGEKDAVAAELEDGYDAVDLAIEPHMTVDHTARIDTTRLTTRPGRIIQVAGAHPPPRPDFTKLQLVDLVAKEVTVGGGIRFPLSDGAHAEIAAIVVRVVREAIIRDLEAALGNPVQPVQEAGGAGEVGLPPVSGEGSPTA